MDITVVIPTHNRRRLLARTLHAVLAQRDVDLEVVVVDDGGADDTAALVRSMGDPRIRVLRHPEARGVSAARNTGIAQATGDWLAFVDDDDLWAPDKLRSQLNALDAAPSAGWSCTGSVNINATCDIAGGHLPPLGPWVADQVLRQNCVPGGGSGVVASRDLIREIGSFDEALSNIADWDFYIRLALHAPLAAVSEPQMGYFIHTQGMAHGVERSVREFRYLDVKYAAERRRRGVDLNETAWLRYLAGMAYDSGLVGAGIRLHAELVVRKHRWRSLRSIGLGLMPAGVRKARARRYVPPPLPAQWAGATRWLDPYRSGWLE